MNNFERVSEKEYKNSLKEMNGYESVDNIPLPIRATANSAGYDFYCPIDYDLYPNDSVLIPTGIKCQLDEDRVLLIYPRSSLGFKYFMRLANTTGVIDPDYYNNPTNEGHIFIKIRNEGNEMIKLSKGDRFAQGIFIRFDIAEEDEIKKRRMGGMGSTND